VTPHAKCVEVVRAASLARGDRPTALERVVNSFGVSTTTTVQWARSSLADAPSRERRSCWPQSLCVEVSSEVYPGTLAHRSLSVRKVRSVRPCPTGYSRHRCGADRLPICARAATRTDLGEITGTARARN